MPNFDVRLAHGRGDCAIGSVTIHAAALGWPSETKMVIIGVEIALALYALTLLPTKLVISDDGLYQKLLFSEFRLRWEEMVEWRHCDGGEKYEDFEMREKTRNKWHSWNFGSETRLARNIT